MTSINRAIHLALPAVALLSLPWNTTAQVGSEPVPAARGQALSSRAETGWLSAAIEEIRRSPFHAARSAADPGSGEFAGSWLPLPATSPAWPVWTPSSDSTLSNKRVFLAALGASALTFYPGYAIAVGGATSTGGDAVPLLLAGLAVPVFGTAAGTTLAGARFPTALAGSALGLGAAVVTLAVAGPPVDPDDSLVLFIGIPAATQAAITTLIVSQFN